MGVHRGLSDPPARPPRGPSHSPEAEAQPSYHVYDFSIPLIAVDKKYHYDEVLDWIVGAVAPLGPEYQASELANRFDKQRRGQDEAVRLH